MENDSTEITNDIDKELFFDYLNHNKPLDDIIDFIKSKGIKEHDFVKYLFLKFARSSYYRKSFKDRRLQEYVIENFNKLGSMYEEQTTKYSSATILEIAETCYISCFRYFLNVFSSSLTPNLVKNLKNKLKKVKNYDKLWQVLKRFKPEEDEVKLVLYNLVNNFNNVKDILKEYPKFATELVNFLLRKNETNRAYEIATTFKLEKLYDVIDVQMKSKYCNYLVKQLKNDEITVETFIDIIKDDHVCLNAGLKNLPKPLKEIVVAKMENKATQDNDFDFEDEFINLNGQRDTITIISNKWCLDNLLDLGEVVGVDSEWMPQKTKFEQQSDCSIVQISDGKRTFIVDCLLIEFDSEAEKILTEFFKCRTAIFFDFSGDFKAMNDAFRNSVKQAKVIDLKQGEYSLKKLTIENLGKGLRKKEQCSNWNVRPLREKQIHYSALDAVVLVWLFEKLRKDQMKYV